MPTLKDRILQLVSSTHGITDTQLAAGSLTVKVIRPSPA
jgi:hypothetical protein